MTITAIPAGFAWFGRDVFEMFDNGVHRGFDVWWSDRFGPCNPITASNGGPMSHEGDPIPENQQAKLERFKESKVPGVYNHQRA